MLRYFDSYQWISEYDHFTTFQFAFRRRLIKWYSAHDRTSSEVDMIKLLGFYGLRLNVYKTKFMYMCVKVSTDFSNI